MTDRPADVPLFEVAGGGATPEEIAALTVVLAAAASARQDTVPAGQPAVSPGWAERSRLLRSPLAHAPGGWRASARPR
jgi:hypothetical protein